MIKFISGLFIGLILSGSLATAHLSPCGDTSKILRQLKSQAQIENLRFKQRLFIERYERGKR